MSRLTRARRSTNAGERATEREHSAFQLAWAVFALAGDRLTPAPRADWSPPIRWDPDL